MRGLRSIASFGFVIALAASGAAQAGGEAPERLDAAPYGWDLATDADWLGLQVDRLHLGGWLDASYRDSDLSGEGSSVAVNHVNSFLDLRFEDRWQLFIEAEIEYQPAVETLEREGEVEIEQGYLNYAWSDAVEVRAGRFSTPFGYWTPKHWSISTDTIIAPLHEERRFVPEQQIGARLHGVLFPSDRGGRDLRVDYSLFGGYAADGMGTGRAIGPSLGADLRVSEHEWGFAGVSVLSQEVDDLSPSRRTTELSGIAYGELLLPCNFLLRGEYLTQRRSGRVDAVGTRHAAYAKLRWSFSNFYANYRIERADDEELGRNARQWVHRWTLGYSPTPRIRLRAEYARHEVSRSITPDFESWGLWLGVFF